MSYGPGQLTPTEQTELTRLETVVEVNLIGFCAAGAALAQIRDKKLYRAIATTFADYCRLRWDMGKSHAYRLIAAAEVVANLSPKGDENQPPPPANEAQARELACLPPEIRRQIWGQAVNEHGPEPTAREVRDVAETVAENLTFDAVAREEQEALARKSTPSGPPRALVSRIEELLGRLAKLFRRTEFAEEAENHLEKLRELAGR